MLPCLGLLPRGVACQHGRWGTPVRVRMHKLAFLRETCWSRFAAGFARSKRKTRRPLRGKPVFRPARFASLPNSRLGSPPPDPRTPETIVRFFPMSSTLFLTDAIRWEIRQGQSQLSGQLSCSVPKCSESASSASRGLLCGRCGGAFVACFS